MLEICNIYKRFDGVHALENVSLTVNEGAVVGLVGDNGAGKSTLMKCVSRVLNTDSGKIFFNHTDITEAGPAQARAAGIEMIYQDLALCRKQDVVTNVFLGRERGKIILDRKIMRDICQALFSELGIDISCDTIVGNLSGGQQQSIAIARAMLSKPKLLIMDEPTAALAARESHRVLDHIVRAREQGTCVIVISHNLPAVLQVASRIVVMKHGAVKFDLATEKTNIRDLTEKIVGE